jgi:hypothetical protein
MAVLKKLGFKSQGRLGVRKIFSPNSNAIFLPRQSKRNVKRYKYALETSYKNKS